MVFKVYVRMVRKTYAMIRRGYCWDRRGGIGHAWEWLVHAMIDGEVVACRVWYTPQAGIWRRLLETAECRWGRVGHAAAIVFDPASIELESCLGD